MGWYCLNVMVFLSSLAASSTCCPNSEKYVLHFCHYYCFWLTIDDVCVGLPWILNLKIINIALIKLIQPEHEPDCLGLVDVGLFFEFLKLLTEKCSGQNNGFAQLLLNHYCWRKKDACINVWDQGFRKKSLFVCLFCHWKGYLILFILFFNEQKLTVNRQAKGKMPSLTDTEHEFINHYYYHH